MSRGAILIQTETFSSVQIYIIKFLRKKNQIKTRKDWTELI